MCSAEIKTHSSEVGKNRYVINIDDDYDLVRNPMRKQLSVFPAYKKYYRKAEHYFRTRIENQNVPWRAEEYYRICNEMHKIMLNGDWYKQKSLMGQVKGGKLRRATAPKSGRPHIGVYAKLIAEKHQLKIQSGPLQVRRVKENLPHNPPQGGHQYPIGHQGLVSYYRSAVVSLNAYLHTDKAEKKLKSIADLYHTMINARPYTQVNQSLFMNQINVLLQLSNFTSVHHGHLDHLAHRFDYREFRRLFHLHTQGQLEMARYKQGEFLGFVRWSQKHIGNSAI